MKDHTSLLVESLQRACYTPAPEGMDDFLIQLCSALGDQFYLLNFYYCLEDESTQNAIQELFIELRKPAKIFQVYRAVLREPVEEQGNVLLCYTMKMVKNICIKNWEHKIRNCGQESLDALENNQIELCLPLREDSLSQDIKEALLELPEEFQELIKLKYLEGYSYHRIAEDLNLTLDICRKKILKALALLRNIIGGYEPIAD